MSDDALEDFQTELVNWFEAHCPESVRLGQKPIDEDRESFKRAYIARGFTTPTWPSQYGGGGLSKQQAQVLQQVTMQFTHRAPAPSFFGTTMLGPVLLEFGNEAQKKEHLTNIANCEVQWCQGYSEPGAGSDLASLQTRAVREGDQYVINGSKIWTTGAHNADWIFCLTRTDPAAAKHDGISFILFDLRQAGVTISPIPLISGASEFCQVFFEDVRAEAHNLVGELNGGWTIAKRLLQHERAMLSSGGSSGASGGRRKKRTGPPTAPKSLLAEQVRPHIGDDDEGPLGDAALRHRIAQWELDSLCFGLSLRRSGEQAKSGQGPGAATSMFKLYASEMNKRRSEIMMSARGVDGLGWTGDAFSPTEIAETRSWLRSKGNSIEGGTSEVQLNVIAKRVLGLPD